MSDVTVFVCSNVGLSGDKVFISETPNGFEARQAIAIFGSYQMAEADLEKIDYNPFHSDFCDNYVSGCGATKEDAVEALNADAKRIADSLWN